MPSWQRLEDRLNRWARSGLYPTLALLGGLAFLFGAGNWLYDIARFGGLNISYLFEALLPIAGLVMGFGLIRLATRQWSNS